MSSKPLCLVPKVATRGVLKKLLLKISQYSQECWSYFLIKLLASRSATVLKRDSNTGVFLWILQIFKNTYFEEELQPAICVHRGCNKFQRSEVSELTFVAAFQRDKEIFQSDSNQHYFLIFTSLRCCFAVLLQKDM